MLANLRHDLGAPTRWPALDGVRGVALLAVLGFHGLRLAALGTSGGGAVDSGPWWWPAGTARFALDVFFVLSGFLVVASWRSLRARLARGEATRLFARRRVARILPAYWFSLLILVPLLAPEILFSPAKLGLLVSVQQYMAPGLASEVNTVYWSLTTEVQFYLLVPLLAVCLVRFGAWKVVAVATVATVLWREFLPWGLPPSLVMGRMEQFALGAIAGAAVLAHERGESSLWVRWARFRWMGVLLAVATAILGVWQAAILDGMTRGWFHTALHPLVSLLVAVWLVRLLTLERTRPSLLSNPILRWLGLVSYSTYLFHYPIMKLGLGLSDLGPESSPGLAMALAMGLAAISLVIGTCGYVLVERPFIHRWSDPAGSAREVQSQTASSAATDSSPGEDSLGKPITPKKALAHTP